MPYDSSKIELNMTFYKANEFSKYENMWSIENFMPTPTSSSESNTILRTMKLEFRRKNKNYLYTFPTYVTYMLTLLMFMLPQNSNQRILIGTNLQLYSNFCFCV